MDTLNTTRDERSPLTPTSKKDRKKIQWGYTVFFISFMVALIPVTVASLFAVMICVCTLAALYSMRSNADEDSLLENHATFLIRTFWRANLYLVMTTVLAGLYLTVFADYQPLKPCMMYLENNIVAIAQNASAERLMQIFKPCKETVIRKNLSHFVLSGLIITLPVGMYLAKRAITGYRAMLRDHLIAPDKL